ncbi:hypothetical protein GCM10023144_19980 [Pigmentiphaga soli]|uniref:histidine kinase n=1 Tax=Pigmentiphaga soli TaxID=1007095 RepID=A0ABP8GXW3_9BURK
MLILNADDSESSRRAKSRILEQAGYEVVEAATGKEALTHAHDKHPALMLLDIRLPDIDGLEVCRRIKQDPATRGILVLQTSASAAGRDRVRAFHGGADSYLVEPIEADELIANVKALLRLKAAEDAHRTAEQALRESEERFRQMAETIADVFWIYDAQARRALYVSPAYVQIWRRPLPGPDEDIRDGMDDIHPDDRERVRHEFELAMQTGAYDQEFRLLHPDGSITWIHDRGFPIRAPDGTILRLTGVAQDVTDRKLAEQMLRNADRRKDEFLAMLAHELRNPLAPIRNAVELLRLRRPADSDIPVKAREIIARQVDHLSRLVDELLDVSRITHGKISLVKETVPLSAIVRAACEAVRPLIDSRMHRFETVMPDHEIWLFADPVRLAQVLGNLLNNAAKYTPPRGTIVLSACPREDRVAISVRDNGVGIDPQILPHVFDLFMQANPSLDRSHGGLGVGLSLAQSLARMHDGHITAQSAGRGEGSEFVLDIPVARHGPPLAGGLDALQMPPAPRNILIVEDSRDAAEGMALLLSTRGHTVKTAFDGLSGLAIARITRPDVIILDIGLPNMDGYQLARELRRIPETAAARLIAMTGYGQPEDRQKSMAAGIDRHLVKPVDLQQLEAAIDNLPQ